MLDALFKAFGEVMHDQLALAGHRMFIGSLFTGSEEGALTRLRAHVESLDDAQYDAFIQVAQAMRTEAYASLREVEASGGNDAWGGSFEDRMAFMMAQIQTGDRSQSNARVQQAQGAVAGLGRVIELSELYRHEKHRAARAEQPVPAPYAAAGESRIQSMLDDVMRTGQLPEGLMEALAEVQDPAVLERMVAKLKAMGGEAAGDRPLDNIADYYRPGPDPYDLLWPLGQKLAIPFDELDRSTQFTVLFGECRRRLAEAASLRNGGSLDQAEKAFNECLVRADQLEVPMLKSDAYQGLLSVAEKRGDRASAKRYLQLARREHERQCSPQS